MEWDAPFWMWLIHSAIAGSAVLLLGSLASLACRQPIRRLLLARLTMRGKAAVLLICDETGRSALVELASGHAPVVMPREEQRSWQACSNFCPSGQIPNRDDPRVMENAYARYGRMAHLLDGGLAERSVAGMKRLTADIVQPGPVCHAPQCWFKTAYAFVAEVRSRRMHLCPGHPAEASYIEVSL